MPTWRRNDDPPGSKHYPFWRNRADAFAKRRDNLKEAVQMGDRVAVVIRGELKQVGAPKHIKGNPVDGSVNEFLRELQIDPVASLQGLQ